LCLPIYATLNAGDVDLISEKVKENC